MQHVQMHLGMKPILLLDYIFNVNGEGQLANSVQQQVKSDYAPGHKAYKERTQPPCSNVVSVTQQQLQHTNVAAQEAVTAVPRMFLGFSVPRQQVAT